MSVNTKTALFLFGGPEGVFDELTRIIQKKLKNYCANPGLDELEHYIGLEENTLSQIVDGSKKVDKKIFLALKSALRLSLQEALGEPKKLEDSKLMKYWEEKWKSKPVRLVAYGNVQSGTRISGNPIDLEAYVTLRAIGEFYRLES